MKKILFMCNWGESPQQLLDRYKRQTPGCLGTWKGITAVGRISEADVFIVLEGLEKGVRIDYDRAILIKREPDFISKAKSHAFRNVLDWQSGHCGVVWWLSKSYDELKRLPYPNKTKAASCVVSSKHRHRNRFIKSLFGRGLIRKNREAHQIDLFGRGHSKFRYGSCYKGALGGGTKCKLLGLLPYRYSIVLENSIQENYWTEKLADAYLSWCVPIYWGCPNLSDFFDENTYSTIELNAKMAELNDIIDGEIDSTLIDRLSVERSKILEKYNIWEVVWKEVERGFL